MVSHFRDASHMTAHRRPGLRHHHLTCISTAGCGGESHQQLHDVRSAQPEWLWNLKHRCWHRTFPTGVDVLPSFRWSLFPLTLGRVVRRPEDSCTIFLTNDWNRIPISLKHLWPEIMMNPAASLTSFTTAARTNATFGKVKLLQSLLNWQF